MHWHQESDDDFCGQDFFVLAYSTPSPPPAMVSWGGNWFCGRFLNHDSLFRANHPSPLLWLPPPPCCCPHFGRGIAQRDGLLTSMTIPQNNHSQSSQNKGRTTINNDDSASWRWLYTWPWYLPRDTAHLDDDDPM